MNFIAHCIYEGHEEENTLGFCFHLDCSESPEFCYMCQNDRQLNHLSDCLRFKQILQIIKNQFDHFSSIQIELNLELLRIQQQFQKLQGSLKQKKQILITLFDQINGSYYNKAKQNLFQLRECIKKDTEQLSQKIVQIQQKSTKFQNIVQEFDQIFRDYYLNKREEYDQTPTQQFSNIIEKKYDHQLQQNKQLEPLAMDNSQNRQKSDQQQKLQIEVQQNRQQNNSFDLQDEEILFQVQLQEIQSQEQFQNQQNIQTAQDLLQNAQNLLREDKFREASNILKEALNYDSGNEEIYYLYSQSLLRQNREQEALKMIDKCIQLNSKYADAYLVKGTILNQLGRNQEALEILRKFEKSQQFLDIKFYSVIAEVLFSLRQYEEALNYCEKAINFDKTFAKAYNIKACVYSHCRKFDLALKNYDLALQYGQWHPIILKNKGNLLRNMGRYDDALACYDKVIIQGDFHQVAYREAWDDKLQILLQLQRNNEALIILNQRIELEPNNRQLYLSKISVLKRLGLDQEAEANSYMINQI